MKTRTSITIDAGKNQISVGYDDGTSTVYTDPAAYLEAYPDREADTVALQVSVANLPGLDAVRSSAMVAIDAAAGEARARYITTAAGQDSTYLLKAADADAYKAAGYPDAQIANYPWVLAKAKAMVATPAAADYQAAADLIIATRDMWVATGVQIEEARERGKAAVTAAADIAGVEVARVAAVGELGAI